MDAWRQKCWKEVPRRWAWGYVMDLWEGGRHDRIKQLPPLSVDLVPR